MTEPYQLLSGVYDDGEWGNHSRSYVEHIGELERRFAFQPKSVLDISCGTGTLLGDLSDHYRVVGSDISASMIEQARTSRAGIWLGWLVPCRCAAAER